MKKIVVLGTTHEIQRCDYEGTNQFKKALGCLIAKYYTRVVFEEWNPKEQLCQPGVMQTIGQLAACEQNPPLPWKNVGPVEEGGFWTDDHERLYTGSTSVWIRVYGPIANQIKREKFMLDEINKIMANYNGGLFICGLAHLHSMAEKLEGLGFRVEAYEWLSPWG